MLVIFPASSIREEMALVYWLARPRRDAPIRRVYHFSPLSNYTPLFVDRRRKGGNTGDLG